MWDKKLDKIIVLIAVIFFSAPFVFAGNSGNTGGHAWAEKFGWISLGGSLGSADYGVTVGEAALSGYAWSEKTGWINFDDSGSYYAVTKDAEGVLSGYAWSEKVGYISFDDSSANNYYQVTLGECGAGEGGEDKSGAVIFRGTTIFKGTAIMSPGKIWSGLCFSGYAWAEKGGYISFNDPGDLYGGNWEGGRLWTCGIDQLEDIDGNLYNTVQIGDQCWMTENMRTTSYPNGDPITKGCEDHTTCGGTGPLLWGDDTALYSCPPNAANNGQDCAAAESLGLLYQWSAAMDGATASGSQGICPDGWHVPADWEQHILEDYLDEGTCNGSRDGSYDCSPAGSKLAGDDAADADWTAGTLKSHEDFDASGFNAPPAGGRYPDGYYGSRAYGSVFWSSSEAPAGAWYRYLGYLNAGVYRNDYSKAFGFSVRCLKN